MMAAEVILFCSARVSLLIDAMARRKRGRKIATAAANSCSAAATNPREPKGELSTIPLADRLRWHLCHAKNASKYLGDGRIHQLINQFGALMRVQTDGLLCLLAYWVSGLHSHHHHIYPCSNHQVVMTVSLPHFQHILCSLCDIFILEKHHPNL